MSEIPRLSVDFMSVDPTGRFAHIRDKDPTGANSRVLQALKIRMRVVLYEPCDSEVEATLAGHDPRLGVWMADPDWSTVKYPDES